LFATRDALDGIRQLRSATQMCSVGNQFANGGGFQLLRDIRALGPENGGSVPVIAMTAFAQISDPESTNASGFQEHRRKSFAPDQLLKAIRSTLRG